MKAKDMAVRYENADNKRDELIKLFDELLKEYPAIIDKRKPSTAHGLRGAVLCEVMK